MADERLTTDVLIVGAGTTGSFLAWKLALSGHRCLVVERDPLESLGTHIGPFHMEETAFEEFGIPKPAGDELLHEFSDMTMWSPSLGSSSSFRFATVVMDKPLFTQRLHGYARAAGAEIVDGVDVTGLTFRRGMLSGVTGRGRYGDVTIQARLVFDASGIDGAVRTRMPRARWFENDPVSADDTIYVYMETWADVSGEVRPGSESYPHLQGWRAPGPGDTHIVGIGAGGGMEAARRRHAAFVTRLPFEGRVVGSTAGLVPYRRPPYSLVDNALLVLGDAACMNKPFSGEGVASAFAGCEIAVDVASRALAGDDVTREALWPMNSRYFRGQGAKFAFLTAVMPALMTLSEGELDFLFSLPGLMSDRSSTALQRDYEVRTDPGEALSAAPGLLRGIAGGRLRPASLAGIARAGLVAGAIKKRYERYPDHPLELGGWIRGVDRLWRYADRVRHSYFERSTAQGEVS